MDKAAPLLIRDYLAAPERLTLFRTSKALALSVLQNAALMTFTPGGRQATASDTQLSTAMHLASHATHNGVTLAMRHRLVTPTEAVWQRMTTLSLYGVHLTFEHCSMLRQLSIPQHLYTLRLERCTLDFRSSRVASSSMGAPIPVHTLICDDCQPASYLPHALCLIDKKQLRELTVRAPDHDFDHTAHGAVKLPFLKHLSALLRLCLHRKFVEATDFKAILSHFTLKSLTVDTLDLEGYTATQPCSLQEVRLHVCDTETLACLPLAHLQCCIVHRLGCGSLQTLTTVLQHQDKLVFQGMTGSDHWDPSVPVFQLRLALGEQPGMQERIIAMCTRHLQGALTLEHATTPTLHALQAALPLSITTLCFSRYLHIAGVEGSLVNHLPGHVKQLVLSQLQLSQERLRLIFTGVTRRVKITLHDVYAYNVGLTGLPDDRARFTGLLQEWLTSYPNQVEWEMTGKNLRIV